MHFVHTRQQVGNGQLPTSARNIHWLAFISPSLACIVNITIPAWQRSIRACERGINVSLRLAATHIDGGYRQ